MFGGYSALWAISGKVSEWLGFPAGAEIPQTVAFVGVRSLLSTLVNLPWSVYFTFWVEQKHGFNKQVGGGSGGGNACGLGGREWRRENTCGLVGLYGGGVY